MKLNERQKQILEITEEKGRVSSAYLSRRLYVSEMTVRRDLNKMSAEGIIKRYHGGALACESYPDYSFETRMKMHEKEKKQIAAVAAKYISSGQTIFLHSSSTCAYVVPCLKEHKNIRIVTNSVQITLMATKYGIPCLITGGEYSERERCLIGRVAENTLREINTDIAFLSCSGISEDGMVTELDEDFAAITRIAFKNASKKIILADNSKLNSIYTYNICTLDEADDVIVF